MKVVSLNDNIRKKIIEIYDDIYFFNEKSKYDINEIFNNLKNKNEYTRYIIGLLLSTSYICLTEELKFQPNNAEYKEKIKSYEKITEIDLYIDKMTQEDLLNLFFDTYNFDILDYDTKRIYINNALFKKQYLKRIFPCYILDVINYNVFTSEKILEQLNIFNELYEEKEESIYNTIIYVTEKLIELYEENFENYELIMLDIIEKYYKYNKYKQLNNFQLEDDTIRNINDIEEDLYSMINFCGNSSYLLEPIINDYINYLIDKRMIKKVNSYYLDDENNKQLTDLYKNINKIKYNDNH